MERRAPFPRRRPRQNATGEPIAVPLPKKTALHLLWRVLRTPASIGQRFLTKFRKKTTEHCRFDHISVRSGPGRCGPGRLFLAGQVGRATRDIDRFDASKPVENGAVLETNSNFRQVSAPSRAVIADKSALSSLFDFGWDAISARNLYAFFERKNEGILFRCVRAGTFLAGRKCAREVKRSTISCGWRDLGIVYLLMRQKSKVRSSPSLSWNSTNCENQRTKCAGRGHHNRRAEVQVVEDGE